MSFRFNWRNLWRRRPEYGPRYERTVVVSSMSDVPDETGKNIYVVGSLPNAKWVVFNCPCERGHQLRVPLMQTASPRWKLRMTRSKVTLFPSVSVDNDPCTSHFWLNDSRVEWARWMSDDKKRN